MCFPNAEGSQFNLQYVTNIKNMKIRYKIKIKTDIIKRNSATSGVSPE